jgi:hypothetical protein
MRLLTEGETIRDTYEVERFLGEAILLSQIGHPKANSWYSELWRRN